MPKKTITGTVISCKNDKTVVILTTKRFKNKKYGKIVSKSKKYHAHDPENKCSNGDLISLTEHRPFSKKKKWLVKYNN